VDDETAVRVTRGQLERAAEQAGVPQAVPALWAALVRQVDERPASDDLPAHRFRRTDEPPAGRRSRAAEVAVYTGGVIALLAMTVFAGSGWAAYGAGAGLAIVSAYLLVFVLLAELLRRRHPQPAGVVAAVAVATVPLVVYAAHAASGLLDLPPYADYDAFGDWGTSAWMAMEVSALVAAVAAWLRHRASFLLAPGTVALSWLVLDLGDATDSDLGRQVAAWLLAAGLFAGALLLDRRGMRREGFWPHLGAVLVAGLAVLLSLEDVGTSGTPVAVAYLVLGAAAIAAGVWLDRRVHLAVGGLYLVGGLSYFAFDVFGDSLFFAPALALIGLSVVAGGVLLARGRRRPAR
jgi:hypothetical protein